MTKGTRRGGGVSVTPRPLFNTGENPVKIKVKCTLVQALRLCTGLTAHRGRRNIVLLFLDHGTRRGWGVSVTPRPLFTPGEDPGPIVQEAAHSVKHEIIQWNLNGKTDTELAQCDLRDRRTAGEAHFLAIWFYSFCSGSLSRTRNCYIQMCLKDRLKSRKWKFARFESKKLMVKLSHYRPGQALRAPEG